MNSPGLTAVIKNYRQLLARYREGPAVAQLSAEGQQSRFKKLAEVGDLNGKTILDIGCGLGDLLPFLERQFSNITYTGIDIVPELIDAAVKRRARGATFRCHNLIEKPIAQKFDFVMISGIFNNAEIPEPGAFLKHMIKAAFDQCTNALAFNFISTRVNFTDPRMVYHDPQAVFGFCLEQLSPKIKMHHHYDKCDVAMFVYR
jgi:SAM-dependent methyltransferase